MTKFNFISKIIEHRVSEIFQMAKFEVDRMIDIDKISLKKGKPINIVSIKEALRK